MLYEMNNVGLQNELPHLLDFKLHSWISCDFVASSHHHLPSTGDNTCDSFAITSAYDSYNNNSCCHVARTFGLIHLHHTNYIHFVIYPIDLLFVLYTIRVVLYTEIYTIDLCLFITFLFVFVASDSCLLPFIDTCQSHYFSSSCNSFLFEENFAWLRCASTYQLPQH